MAGEEHKAIEEEIRGVSKVCSVIKVITYVALALFTVVWLVAFGAVVFGFFDPGSTVEGAAVLYLALFGIIVIAILWFTAKIFKDASKRNPFSKKQTNRLRVIAALLLAFAIIDMFLSASFSSGMIIGGYYFGVETGDLQEASGPTVNLGTIFFAIAIYCVSFIFQYGNLLQKFTDETV